MSEPNVVVFGNCQAEALEKVMRAGLPEGASVEWFSNNARTGNFKPPEQILEAAERADVVVFQPLRRAHGVLSEEHVRKVTASRGASLTFPYIFNSGIASLSAAPNDRVLEYGVFGEDRIVERLDAGASVKEVIGEYVRGGIDFDLSRRFDESLAWMARREQAPKEGGGPVDIQLADFIAENVTRRRLLLTHNHPTTPLLAEICARVKALTGLELDLAAIDALDPNHADLPVGQAPITPYDVESLHYEFAPDPNWQRLGARLISRIANAHLGNDAGGHSRQRADASP